jgi:hypothetical protein
MALPDLSRVLFDGMQATLEVWNSKYGGPQFPLYWLLRIKSSQFETADERAAAARVPDTAREVVMDLHRRAERYWSDVRYASLEPITMLWGTIVNALRVAANSDRATDSQRDVFAYSLDSLVAFFRSARDRMEVADHLYHVFKAMPAPECQALAALLNVHVDAQMDAHTLCRLVRLLDHEGPMSEREHQDLAALSNTHLVDAAFRGLRRNA